MNTIVCVAVAFCLFPEVLGHVSSCNFPGNASYHRDQYSCFFSGPTTILVEDSDVCSVWPHTSTDKGEYILYVVLDSLPVLILVPLILFFNINLASGPGHSLVFTYQVLVAVSHISPPSPFECGCYYCMVLLISGFPVLFNAPLHLFRSLTLTHYALGYVKILIAGVMVVLYLFLATCSQCPVQCCRSCWAKLRRSVRNWRERHLPQRPVFTGVCSVAILIYGSLVEVSFRLLYRCELTSKVCHFSGNGDNYTLCYMNEYTVSSQPFCWNSHGHKPYFIPAYFFIGIAVLLSLPFFYHPGVPALVSYLTRGRVQLPRLHRVRPIFDLFQGVYKPKMQFFTGLHLLYRIAIWSAVAFASNETKMYAFMFLWSGILGIHSLFQPFESRRLNYIETLLMVDVALTALNLNLIYSIHLPYADGPVLFVIKYILPFGFPNIPLVCVVVYYLYKCARRFCCCRRKREEYAEIQGRMTECSFQGERWIPPDNETLSH